MATILNQEKGMALLITLMLVTVLVSVAFSFNSNMMRDLNASKSFQEGVRFNYLAKSGFNAGLAVLHNDMISSEYDALTEEWARMDILAEDDGFFDGRGKVSVDIVDQAGLIQVNALLPKEKSEGEQVQYDLRQSELWMRFLSSEEFELDEDDVKQIIADLIDWLDDDGDAGTTMIGTMVGAEESYYRGLEEPYSIKNGPIDNLEELLLVRGVTKELFYGTDERPGIAQYLTVQTGQGEGRGKININTAPPLVLKALADSIDQGIVEELQEYRNNEDNDLLNEAWYKVVRSDLQIDPNILTVSSNNFKIVAVGRYDQRSGTVTGMVRRKKNDNNGAFVQVLSRRVE